MDIATLTDAASVPGTEQYYLYNIYQLILLIFVFIVLICGHFMFRTFFNKLFGGNKNEKI